MQKDKESKQNPQTSIGEAPILLGDEPDTSRSLSAAIAVFKAKGCIDKEKNKRKPVVVISDSKRAKLEAKSVTVDEQRHDNDHRRGRNSQLREVKEKSDYKPEIVLEYTDDSGRKLEQPKEAYRYLCHKFHGVGPGKNKIDKRNKKLEIEDKLKEGRIL